VTAMQITDEMVKAADAAFEASLSRYHGSGFNGYDFFPQIRAALEAVLPMIRAGVVEECRDSIMTAIPMPHPDDQSSERGRRIGMQDAAMILAREAAAIRALEQKP
jgi:hypothetical protein